MRKIVIITAPSGAGKSTIINEILKDKSLNLNFSISATTRPPRQNEVDGLNYYFLTTEEFKQKIQNNEFVEWQEVYPNLFYGTLKSEINRIFEQNKNVLFDVDVLGAINIKKIFLDNSISIFIKPPSIEELRNRLLKRGTETNESLEKRIQRAQLEMSYQDHFDYCVVNDNLQLAIDNTKALILNFLNSKTK